MPVPFPQLDPIKTTLPYQTPLTIEPTLVTISKTRPQPQTNQHKQINKMTEKILLSYLGIIISYPAVFTYGRPKLLEGVGLICCWFFWQFLSFVAHHRILLGVAKRMCEEARLGWYRYLSFKMVYSF